MNRHVYQLLTVLLNEEGFVTSHYLSQKSGISVRTVKRLMPAVRDYLELNSIDYETERGKGTKVELPYEHRKLYYAGLHESSIGFYSSDERMAFLLAELFRTDDYLAVEYFAAVLRVSKSTVEKDLENAEKFLQKWSLKLKKKRGAGLIISGSRGMMELAVVNLIYQYLNADKLDINAQQLITLGHVSEEITGKARKKVWALVNTDSVQYMLNQVNIHDKNIKHILVDESFFKLILLLSRLYDQALRRREHSITQESLIQLGLREDDAKVPVLQGLRGSLLHLIMGDLLPYLSEDEVDSVVTFLKSARRRNENGNIFNEKEDENLCQALMEAIERETGQQLDASSSMIARLKHHLILLCRRVDSNILATNQYTEQLKNNYQQLFEAIDRAVKSVWVQPVSEDEISFITLHLVADMLEKQNQRRVIRVALVCMSGFATSQFLKETLRSTFSQVEICTVLSSGRINELKLIQDGIEIIVSTVKINTNLLDTITVSPILTEKDKNIISKRLKIRHAQGENRNLSMDRQQMAEKIEVRWLLQLADQMLFEEVHSCDNLTTLVQHIAKQITLSDRSVDLALRLLNRERYGSTVLPEHHLILLHCRFLDIIRFGVIRLKNPLLYQTEEGEEWISVAVVMVIPETLTEAVGESFSAISAAMATNSAFTKIICTGSKKEIIQNVKSLV